MILALAACLLLMIVVQGSSSPKLYNSSKLKGLVESSPKRGESIRVVLTVDELSYSYTLRLARQLSKSRYEVNWVLGLEKDDLKPIKKASSIRDRKNVVKKLKRFFEKSTGFDLCCVRVPAEIKKDVREAFERYDLKVLVANAENRRLKAEPEAPIESIHLDIEALQASVGPLNNAPDSALPVDARINTEQIHIPAPAPSTSAVSSNLVCPTPPSQVHAALPSSSSISPSKSRVISKMPAVPVPELEIVDVNDLPPNFNPFRFVQIFASENGIWTRGRGLPLPDIANFRSSPPVNDACGICLGSLKRHALDEAGMEIKGGLVRMPRCIHVYHLSCAVKWFSSNNTCPHCRTPADY